MSLPEGKVLYQGYPLTFADGNGDGVGDFLGIKQHLPYLQNKLGVDGLWLSPFYTSPWKDGGYDVANYCVADEKFGTQAEALDMITAANARDFMVIADFVPSHSSDQHAAFQEALQDPTDTRYIFRDEPPNNWLSVFPRRVVEKGGVTMYPESAWRPVQEYWPNAHAQRLGQHCLTNFAAYQPNWNHANPAVRSDLKAAMGYWLRAGISGFRVDAIDYMDHDRQYRDEALNEHYRAGDAPYDTLRRHYSMRGPHSLEYLGELISVLDEFPDAFMMLESYPDRDQPTDDPIAHYLRYYQEFGQRWPGRVAPFCFELTDLPWRAKLFKKALDTFQTNLRPGDTPVYPGGNHDKSRLASRYGERAARAAAVLQMGLPGVVVVYQGDELGMTDHNGIPQEKLTDPWLGRDRARTPIPWHANNPRAGFSSADPADFVLPIHPEYTRFNVQAQQEDPSSTWQVYRKAIQLRKATPALAHGGYRPIGTDDRQVFAFARTGEQRGEHNLIFVNFTPERARMNIGHLAARSNVMLSSERPMHQPTPHSELLELAPDEAVVLRAQA